MLPARSAVTDTIVLLGEIAEISGGSGGLRQMAARLDLADMDRGGGVSLSREQVSLRLQLAGIDPRRFRITGAARTVVTLGRDEVSAEGLLAAARQAVRKRLPVDAEDITMRLAQAVTVPSMENKAEGIKLKADVRSAAPVGRVRVEVSIYINGQRRSFVPVFLDVSYSQAAAVARRRLQNGQVLKEEDLTTERQIVDGPDVPLSIDDCTGRRIKTTLMTGQRVTESDLESGVAEEPVLVKNRDMVRLVAKIGSLRITALGEALQDGRAGQTIRVRNVDSNKVVSARVVERALLEVEY